MIVVWEEVGAGPGLSKLYRALLPDAQGWLYVLRPPAGDDSMTFVPEPGYRVHLLKELDDDDST